MTPPEATAPLESAPPPHPRLAEAVLRRVPHADLSPFAGLSDRTAEAPVWFQAEGGLLLAPEDAALPVLETPAGHAPCRAPIVAFGEGGIAPMVWIWGDAPLVAVGNQVSLPQCTLACGDGAAIVIAAFVSSSYGGSVNARNGGLVVIGGHGLWSNGVRIFTDDMHAIRDLETGQRVNPRGGTVTIGDHVWLGLDVMALPNSTIGAHVVVGARAVVSGQLPAHVVAAGAPARVLRSGVTWTYADDL